jgi:hypothetical protein
MPIERRKRPLYRRGAGCQQPLPARAGEVGLLEGWTLAKVVNETIDADSR